MNPAYLMDICRIWAYDTLVSVIVSHKSRICSYSFYHRLTFLKFERVVIYIYIGNCNPRCLDNTNMLEID